ncbi:MAG: hypothetical protein R3B89_16470 [Polyangiaceae bacterium]
MRGLLGLGLLAWILCAVACGSQAPAQRPAAPPVVVSAAPPEPEAASPQCTDDAAVLEQGKALESKGELEAAIGVYAPCVDELAERLGMLARRHPEARRVLERRREALAAEIAEGKGKQDPSICRRLAHFDSILHQEGRTLEVYRAALAHEETQDCARQIQSRIWDAMVELGEYEDAVRFPEDIHNSLTTFAAVLRVARTPEQRMLVASSLESRYGLYFEALIALSRRDEAQKLLEQAAQVPAPARVWPVLLRSALYGGEVEDAEWLLEEAEKLASPAQLEELRQQLAALTAAPSIGRRK